ncbi:polyketide cyclase [Mycobacterium paragordonae]|uniref:SRPBCC family protein n=1 Tax=Mycobacterium paragordonae TaxID=1389713 RepID=A0A386U3C4_9MYCO|nr:SRPBCC family protein [Mycobacterium paragordonae]AYE95036.1 polyketide cyclase [Mycobacterium paragordonae]MDP7735996.1 SRPBCC family protein [Mycobacterium paragordonae]TDK99774.1 SRPBCC family protein [Mycobacterium paragordonae]TDL01835.1 SRPBCC family protein [Mycobacterium paragordonae]TDL05595.1 SRPBCC family protein [Mycobacterium paragordonae]
MTFSVNRFVAAPPQAAWDLLVDLDAWPQWGPSINGAQLDQPGRRLTAGATGTVRTALLVRVPFAVTEFEQGRCWAWKVAGIPATWHRVDPEGDGARITLGVPRWAPAYLAVCELALRRMEKLLT